jgi:hypothetical protein
LNNVTVYVKPPPRSTINDETSLVNWTSAIFDEAGPVVGRAVVVVVVVVGVVVVVDVVVGVVVDVVVVGAGVVVVVVVVGPVVVVVFVVVVVGGDVVVAGVVVVVVVVGFVVVVVVVGVVGVVVVVGIVVVVVVGVVVVVVFVVVVVVVGVVVVVVVVGVTMVKKMVCELSVGLLSGVDELAIADTLTVPPLLAALTVKLTVMLMNSLSSREVSVQLITLLKMTQVLIGDPCAAATWVMEKLAGKLTAQCGLDAGPIPKFCDDPRKLRKKIILGVTQQATDKGKLQQAELHTVHSTNKAYAVAPSANNEGLVFALPYTLTVRSTALTLTTWSTVTKRMPFEMHDNSKCQKDDI